MNTLIIFVAKYLYILVVFVALGFLSRLSNNERNEAIRLLVISIPLALLLVLISSHFIYNPRPFVVNHVQPLIPHDPDNGFPSDHTLVAMMAAIMVLIYNKKLGSVLVVAAMLVGVSRVLAQVHHPLDIMGSILIALCSITVVWFYKFSRGKNLSPTGG